MQSETLAQEFARLVKEYHEGDDHTKPEAWNLLADYAVDNADTISAALAVQTQQGVEEPVTSFAWNEGIDTAPYSTTVLATYFDMDVGEWIVKIFAAERPTAPFTHWMWFASPGEAAELPWRNMDSAPRTGEEFIARVGAGYPAFSCFWNGEAFVHYDKDDGFIRYPVAEWLPMPAAAAVEPFADAPPALVDVPAVESEPVAWQWRSRIKGGAWDSWENGRGRHGHDIPPFMDVEERPLYAHPPRSLSNEGWRPIETAPKDGTAVDLWGSGRRATDVAWGLIRDWMGKEREGWQHGMPDDFEPTHWQPLPNPPLSARKGSSEGDGSSTTTKGISE